jgi:hypothetical protein
MAKKTAFAAAWSSGNSGLFLVYFLIVLFRLSMGFVV